MDEENTDSGPQSPGHTTSVTQRTKKLFSSKEKTNKATASTGLSEDKQNKAGASAGQPKDKKNKATASAGLPKDKKNKATASAGLPKDKNNKATASAGLPKDKKNKATASAGSLKDKINTATKSARLPKDKVNKATASAGLPKDKTSKSAASAGLPKDKTSKSAASTGPPKEKKTENKKSVLNLICEAIEVSGEKKKGISVQSIKKYVTSNYTSEGRNINNLINRAIIKGVEKGTLERAAKSKDATGLRGYFCLPKIEPKRMTKTSKKQNIEEHVSDSEVIEKPVKHRKRNLSDTYIEEIKGGVTSTPKPLLKQIADSADAKSEKVHFKKMAKDKKGATNSEFVLKETLPKKKKLHSSDTEVELKDKKKIMKTLKTVKKIKPDKLKTEKAKSASKAKVNKFNSTEEKENETNAKSE